MSDTKDTGGPAFPVVAEGGHSSGLHPEIERGMTLRDFFAAKAMQGIVAGISSLDEENEERTRLQWEKNFPGKSWGEAAAEQAYHIADAMLKAREQ